MPNSQIAEVEVHRGGFASPFAQLLVALAGVTLWSNDCIAEQLSDVAAITSRTYDWLTEQRLAREVFQPPRIVFLDPAIQLNESYFKFKLIRAAKSTSPVHSWDEATAACKKAVGPQCASGALLALVLDDAVRLVVSDIVARSAASQAAGVTIEGRAVADSTVQATIDAIVASPEYKRLTPTTYVLSQGHIRRALDAVIEYLRLLINIRFGSEDLFLAIHSPDDVSRWKSENKSKGGVAIADSSSPFRYEIVELQFFQQNVCQHATGRALDLCNTWFARAPLSSFDYLLLTPPAVGDDGFLSNQAARVARQMQYQLVYIAGRLPGSSDWWRSLFPLRYGDDSSRGLGSGWGNSATLAIRRSKRPIPAALMAPVGRRVHELAAKMPSVESQLLQDLKVELRPSPVYVDPSENAVDAIEVFGIRLGPARTHEATIPATSAEHFIERMLVLKDKTLQTSPNSQTVADLLSPRLAVLGESAYQAKATWNAEKPVIELSEPIVLHQYLSCLGAERSPVLGSDGKWDLGSVSFASLLAISHFHALDLAAAVGFVKIDRDSQAQVLSSPFLPAISHKKFELVGREKYVAIAGVLEPAAKLMDLRMKKLIADGLRAPTECLADRLSFFLAHEVAHVLMGSPGNLEKNEAIADCVGYLLHRATTHRNDASLQTIENIGPLIYWTARSDEAAVALRDRENKLEALALEMSDLRTVELILSSRQAVEAKCRS